MSGYRLGEQEFVAMDAPVPFEQKQISMQIRPGADHAIFFDLGTVAEPVEVETVVDLVSKEVALARFRTYEGMVGKVVDMEWAGVELSHLQVMILGVRYSRRGGGAGVSRILLGVGGLENAPKALLRVTWELCAVPAA